MGIPLETGGNDAWFDDEVGYRVDRAAYALPEVVLHPGRAGRARPRLPRLAAGQPGRAGVPGGPQAQGRRRRARPAAAWSASSPGSAPASRPSSRSTPRCATGARSASRTAPPARPASPSGTSSRGGSCPGTAAGTSSATTVTAAPPGSSGSPGSPARCAPVGRPGEVHGARGHRPAGPGGQPGAAAGQRRGHGCASGPAPGLRLRRRATASRPGAGTGGWDELTVPVQRPRGAGRGGRRLRRRRRRCWHPPELRDAVVRRLRGVLDAPRPPVDPAAAEAPGEPRRHRPAVPAARPGALPGQPPGHPAGRGRRRVRHHRGPAGQGPRAALRLRHARPHARRPDRRRLGRRPRLPQQRRRRSPGRCGSASTRRWRCSSACGRSPTSPGCTTGTRCERTLLKLEAAAGDAARRQQPRSGSRSRPQGPLADVRRALADGRRVHLTYFVPARDETTERDVDPMRVLLVDGRWYLEGWCRRAEDVRLFRLDRVEALDRARRRRRGARRRRTERDLDEGLFVPSPGRHAWCRSELAPARALGRRLLPGRGGRGAAGDRLLVRLRVADDGWLRQLALRLGGALRVLDPPELAERRTTAARSALAAYAGLARLVTRTAAVPSVRHSCVRPIPLKRPRWPAEHLR